VIKAFYRMKGGEVFVPKIPSARIVDMAAALAPNLPHKIVGIRPGEKLHEVMCPQDDSHLVMEFENHYVIKPAITFREVVDYGIDGESEYGRPVEQGFEYNSGTNPVFLSIGEIRDLCGLCAKA
jgi:UDP-N-acetylglucosamine 4,6-dehydratase